MGGVKTIDMRAHGTQITKTKAMCSHKTKHKAHGQQNKLPAMCKTGHEHAANENTHKPRVHTRHDNMKARSQWKTRAACHTAQDITWMHAADKNTNCVQNHTHTQHTWTRERAAERTRAARSHNETEHGARVSEPRLKTWDSRHECRDPNTTLQHKTRHADERARSSSTLEAAHSHKNRTWRECQGSVTKPWITLDRRQRGEGGRGAKPVPAG